MEQQATKKFIKKDNKPAEKETTKGTIDLGENQGL